MSFYDDLLGLEGRTPRRFFRLACKSLKCLEPNFFKVALPPFRPRPTAAGSFFFANYGPNKLTDDLTKLAALTCEKQSWMLRTWGNKKRKRGPAKKRIS